MPPGSHTGSFWAVCDDCRASFSACVLERRLRKPIASPTRSIIRPKAMATPTTPLGTSDLCTLTSEPRSLLAIHDLGRVRRAARGRQLRDHWGGAVDPPGQHCPASVPVVWPIRCRSTGVIHGHSRRPGHAADLALALISGPRTRPGPRVFQAGDVVLLLHNGLGRGSGRGGWGGAGHGIGAGEAKTSGPLPGH